MGVLFRNSAGKLASEKVIPALRTLLTDSDGAYVFLELRPGSYTLTEIQPAGYTQGINTIGTAGGTQALDRGRSPRPRPGLGSIACECAAPPEGADVCE